MRALGTQASARARAQLLERLRARRIEIERAIFTRVLAVSEDSEDLDPTYSAGVREAIAAAVELGLAGIEAGAECPPEPGPALIAQARLAARSRVPLEMVLRRYFAGQVLLSDFIIEEAERGGLLGCAELQAVVRAQAAAFERVIAAVSEEHTREEECCRLRSTEQRQAERVDRLLAGEPIDASKLGYELEAHHVGLIATGTSAGEVLQALARALDRRLLAVSRDEETTWAWFGGRDPLDLEVLVGRAGALPSGVRIALGEPAQGPDGWRLTHQQARAALPIAQRGDAGAVVRYGEVALLAAVLKDNLLATSLWQTYLAPLETERDGGEVLRETLRAYLAAERNVSSAAVALGVRRHTVTSRLRTIEERWGRPLSSCAAEVEAALRLEDLVAA